MSKKKYLNLFFIGLVLVIIAGLFLNITYVKLVNINGKNFIAELALTSQKQKKGLSQRKIMHRWQAMLFKFNQSQKWPFWMKGMQFNLDILWIANGKIIYIAKNVSFNSKKIIVPSSNANEVLEIKAGLCDKYKFRIGNKVKIYLPFWFFH